MSTMGYVTTLSGAEDAALASFKFDKLSYKVVENGKSVSKNFSDIFEFSRSTSAGRWNEKGVYEMLAANQPRFDYDPITKVLKGLLMESTGTNFVTYSNTLTSTSWVKTAGRVELSGVSPHGRAYKCIPSTAAQAHFVQKTYPSIQNGTWTSTRLLKAGELTKVRAQFFGSQAFAAADFDLVAGTVALTTTGSASISAVGGGWYLCSITGTWAATETITDRWYPVKGTETSFAGNDVDGWYCGSAQLEQNPFPTSYIPSADSFTSRASTATYFDKSGVLKTAGVNVARDNAYIYDKDGKLVPVGLLLEAVGTTNLLKLTTDLSISPWVRASASVSVTDGGVAPDGSVAQMFTMYGTTGHNINQSLSAALTVGTTYTLSMWLKSPNWGNKQFQMAYYDGGVVANGGVVALTSEWKRYEYTFTPTAVAVAPQIRLIGFGNGVEGDKVEIFGPQLETGMSASSYTPSAAVFTGRASTATYLDSQGLLQTAASGVARSDTYKYDSSGVLRPNGLLVETSGTNLLTNSESFDTPNWGQGGPGTSPLVITPNAGAGPRGPSTMSLIKRTDLGIRFSSKTFTVPAGNVSFSQYVRVGEIGRFYTVRLQAGGVGNRIDARFDLTTGLVTSTVVGEVTAAKVNMENLGGGLWRCVTSATSTVPWTVFLFAPADRLMTIDSTPTELSDIYVDAGQIESSPFASSYIPTGAASATRASDVFNVPVATRAGDVSSSASSTRGAESCVANNISGWFNQSLGTIYTQAQHLKGSGQQNKHIVNLQGPTSADWLGMRNAVNQLQVGSGNTSSSATTIIAGNILVDGELFQAALRYANNDAAFCVNSRAIQNDTSCLYPAVVPYSRLFIGSYSAGTLSINGHVKSFNYYGEKLSNDQLQNITT